ncbi:hypothetical protein H9P43_003075 [Blastocladiella emersonii ATCC 22665]|nr:hypothetical protein H9P43_003075 [Blastocladiella emersonii ATCC 22665]
MAPDAAPPPPPQHQHPQHPQPQQQHHSHSQYTLPHAPFRQPHDHDAARRASMPLHAHGASPSHSSTNGPPTYGYVPGSRSGSMSAMHSRPLHIPSLGPDAPATHAAAAFAAAVNPLCAVCGREVYAMEMFLFDGSNFHKSCFKCSQCNKALSIGNAISFNGAIFCTKHNPGTSKRSLFAKSIRRPISMLTGGGGGGGSSSANNGSATGTSDPRIGGSMSGLDAAAHGASSASGTGSRRSASNDNMALSGRHGGSGGHHALSHEDMIRRLEMLDAMNAAAGGYGGSEPVLSPVDVVSHQHHQLQHAMGGGGSDDSLPTGTSTLPTPLPVTPGAHQQSFQAFRDSPDATGARAPPPPSHWHPSHPAAHQPAPQPPTTPSSGPPSRSSTGALAAMFNIMSGGKSTPTDPPPSAAADHAPSHDATATTSRPPKSPSFFSLSKRGSSGSFSSSTAAVVAGGASPATSASTFSSNPYHPSSSSSHYDASGLPPPPPLPSSSSNVPPGADVAGSSTQNSNSNHYPPRHHRLSQSHLHQPIHLAHHSSSPTGSPGGAAAGADASAAPAISGGSGCGASTPPSAGVASSASSIASSSASTTASRSRRPSGSSLISSFFRFGSSSKETAAPQPPMPEVPVIPAASREEIMAAQHHYQQQLMHHQAPPPPPPLGPPGSYAGGGRSGCDRSDSHSHSAADTSRGSDVDDTSSSAAADLCGVVDEEVDLSGSARGPHSLRRSSADSDASSNASSSRRSCGSHGSGDYIVRPPRRESSSSSSASAHLRLIKRPSGDFTVLPPRSSSAGHSAERAPSRAANGSGTGSAGSSGAASRSRSRHGSAESVSDKPAGPRPVSTSSAPAPPPASQLARGSVTGITVDASTSLFGRPRLGYTLQQQQTVIPVLPLGTGTGGGSIPAPLHQHRARSQDFSAAGYPGQLPVPLPPGAKDANLYDFSQTDAFNFLTSSGSPHVSGDAIAIPGAAASQRYPGGGGPVVTTAADGTAMVLPGGGLHSDFARASGIAGGGAADRASFASSGSKKQRAMSMGDVSDLASCVSSAPGDDRDVYSFATAAFPPLVRPAAGYTLEVMPSAAFAVGGVTPGNSRGASPAGGLAVAGAAAGAGATGVTASPANSVRGLGAIRHRGENPYLVEPGDVRRLLEPKARSDYHDYVMEQIEIEGFYYRTFFLGRDHTNYVAVLDTGVVVGAGAAAGSGKSSSSSASAAAAAAAEGKTIEGPVIVSVRRDADSRQYRVLVRTRDRDWRLEAQDAELKGRGRGKISRRQAVAYVLPGFPANKLVKLRTTRVERDLVKLDEIRLTAQLKIGMLFMHRGQTHEEQVFGNRTHTHAFDAFLDVVGDRVELAGFEGFDGGLDTRHGNMGTHSVYAHTREFDIMFHVSTLLPYSDRDPQQIQRKSHIGNDIVCVVYVDESPDPAAAAAAPDTEPPLSPTSAMMFDPTMIRSQYLTVYIVVSPFTMNGTRGFRVAVAAQADVPPFGPSLPPFGFFTNAAQLRDFLLAKIINAENAAFKSAKFKKLHNRTRCMLLEDMVQFYSKNNGNGYPEPAATSSSSSASTGGGGGATSSSSASAHSRSNAATPSGVGPGGAGGDASPAPAPSTPGSTHASAPAAGGSDDEPSLSGSASLVPPGTDPAAGKAKSRSDFELFNMGRRASKRQPSLKPGDPVPGVTAPAMPCGGLTAQQQQQPDGTAHPSGGGGGSMGRLSMLVHGGSPNSGSAALAGSGSVAPAPGPQPPQSQAAAASANSGAAGGGKAKGRGFFAAIRKRHATGGAAVPGEMDDAGGDDRRMVDSTQFPTRTLLFRVSPFEKTQTMVTVLNRKFAVRQVTKSRKGVVLAAFYDLRESVQARDEINCTTYHGMSVSADFLYANDPVDHRVPCPHKVSQGSLCVTLEPRGAGAGRGEPVDLARLRTLVGGSDEVLHFDVDQTGGETRVFVEFSSSKDRLLARDRLERQPFGDYVLRVEFAWDKVDLEVTARLRDGTLRLADDVLPPWVMKLAASRLYQEKPQLQELKTARQLSKPAARVPGFQLSTAPLPQSIVPFFKATVAPAFSQPKPASLIESDAQALSQSESSPFVESDAFAPA